MRKIIIIIFGVVFFSCSENTSEVVQCKNETILRLVEFNESLAVPQPTTRGWFGSLLAVSSADALGAAGGFNVSVKAAAFITAVTGGTAGPAAGVAVLASSALIGAGASYAAYCTTCSYSIPAPTYKEMIKTKTASSFIRELEVEPLVTGIELFDSSIYESLGDAHNDILNELITPVLLTRSGSDQTTPIDPIEEIYESIPFFSEKEMEQLYNESNAYIEDYLVDMNHVNIVNNLQNAEIFSTNIADITTLYLDALESYAVNSSDVITVIDFYADVISSSTDLSDDDKSTLFTLLYVSKSSVLFWEDFFRNNNTQN